jgi:hypothetical protein
MSTKQTVTINVTSKASGIKQYIVSSSTVAKASYRQPISTTLIFITIDGLLLKEKYLKHPIGIKIEDDEGEILVSEPHFSIHASGATIQEAIGEFKRILSDELDTLTEDEHKLGPRLTAQLRYLRSIIRMA